MAVETTRDRIRARAARIGLVRRAGPASIRGWMVVGEGRHHLRRVAFSDRPEIIAGQPLWPPASRISTASALRTVSSGQTSGQKGVAEIQSVGSVMTSASSHGLAGFPPHQGERPADLACASGHATPLAALAERIARGQLARLPEGNTATAAPIQQHPDQRGERNGNRYGSSRSSSFCGAGCAVASVNVDYLCRPPYQFTICRL